MSGRKPRKFNEPAESFPQPAEILVSRIKFDLKCKNERQKHFLKLIETKDKYFTELRQMNRAQWDHDHETVNLDDDR